MGRKVDTDNAYDRYVDGKGDPTVRLCNSTAVVRRTDHRLDTSLDPLNRLLGVRQSRYEVQSKAALAV
jgi:hypothetical protein